MARISLLFSLALVLAIGSVLAHPPTHKKLQKTLCPSTLSKVQAFPYLEVSSFVEKKVQFAPKTIAFKSLFSICKSYIDFLGGVKFSASRDVFHVVHVKFTLMTKAMVIAQAHIGVEGDLAVKLGKSYTVMAERFVNLLEMMSTVSAKYKFDANAKISASESAEIEKCVMKLKSAIRSYVKVISQCSTKFSAGKSIGFPTYPVGFIGGIAKQGLGYAGKIVGAHGQVGAGFEIGAKAKVGVQSEKFLEYGPITKPKGKVGVQGEVKVGGQVHAAGKAKVRAKVGGETGSGYYDGIMKYFGKGHFDAAGKAHVSGGSGFRPLSNPHKKHLD